MCLCVLCVFAFVLLRVRLLSIFCLLFFLQVVDDNLVTNYGNENYHALDDNTVHMPITGVAPAAGVGGTGNSTGNSIGSGGGGGGGAKGMKAGFRGLVRYDLV